MLSSDVENAFFGLAKIVVFVHLLLINVRNLCYMHVTLVYKTDCKANQKHCLM